MSKKTKKQNFPGGANVPEPREKRRTSFSYIVFSLFVTLLGTAVLAGSALYYGSKQMGLDGPLKKATTHTVERGMSTSDIAHALAQEKIISYERVFFLAALLNGKMGSSLKAGEYQFEPGDSMRQVLAKISSGKALAYKITIPEGLTTQQVLARLAAHESLTGNVTATVAEGSLLPDTYLFTRGMTREALLEQMRTAQDKLLEEIWDSRVKGLPIKTKEEALILASIVEKETGVAEERARVAAVFHNRLLANIRLQSDPTIIYGIVGGKGKLDRPIRRSDIDKKTPFNTYKIDGLPPAPIANPGRDAIKAVLQPANVKDLYFVADGSGGHAFAMTLAGHKANVKRWRKIEAKRKLTAANPDTGAQNNKDVEPDSAARQGQEADQASVKSDDQSAEPVAVKTQDTQQAASVATQPPKLPEPNAATANEELPVEGSQSANTSQLAQREIPLPRRKPVNN